MKRTPLQRRAPLRSHPAATVAREEVPRPVFDLEHARAALAKAAAAAQVEREFRPVADPVRPARGTDGSFPSLTRQTIIDRDHHRCQRCGAPATDTWPGFSIQHRIARGAGGTSDPVIASAANGLLLCGSGTTGCHGWVELHPALAAAAGLAVAAWALPASVPVLTYAGWRLLGDNGASWPTATPPNDDAHELAVRRPIHS